MMKVMYMVLLLAHVQVCSSSYWNNLFGACPLARNALEPGFVKDLLSDHEVEPWKEADARGGSWLGNFIGSGDLSDDQCKHHGVVGQNIALTVVPHAIQEHLSKKDPEKPLLMMLCGEPGVGKTLTETYLRRALYASVDEHGNGHGVKLLSGFDYRGKKSEREEIKERLRKEIADQIHVCPTSLVVLDEVQHMRNGTLDAFVEMVGFRQPVTHEGRSIDFRKAIFLLITNEGDAAIREKTEELMMKTPRDELTYDQYEMDLKSLMAEKAAWLSYKNRVDFYVPFLPMTLKEARTLVTRILQEYRCEGTRDKKFASLTWDKNVVDLVASKMLPKDELFLPDGLSSVSRVTSMMVLRSIKELKKSANSDVTLAVTKGKVVATST